MKDYTGTVLRFDERSFNDSINAHYKVLEPINEASRAYEDLDSTFVFDEAVFKDMIANKSSNIHKKYAAIIDAQIGASKFTSRAVIESMKAQIAIHIQTLGDKIEKIFTTITNIYQHSSSFSKLYFDISNISIVDGKATITEETEAKIKDLCEIKIRTEDHNILYNYALEFQAAHKKVVDFIKSKNPKIMQPPYPAGIVYYNGGRFSETQDGNLKINDNVLSGI